MFTRQGKKLRFLSGSIVVILMLGIMATTGLAVQKVITMWTPAWEMAQKSGNPWTWVYNEFERQNPGVKFDVTYYSVPLMEKLLPAFAGGKEPDLSFLMHSEMPTFVGRDLMEPLPTDIQNELTKKAVEPVADFYTWEGKIYGYPYWWDAYVLNWNKDMFKEAGLNPNQPPRTWKEFREYAKKLTKRNEKGKITRVGYAIRYLGQPLGIMDKMGCFWLQKGVYPITPPDKLRGGKIGFNNEDGVEVFDLYRKMLHEDKSTAFGFPDPRVAFLQRKAAMQISESSAIAYRQPKETPGLNWGMALPPYPEDGRKATYMGGWFIALSRNSPHKKTVFDFFRYLMQPQTDQFIHLVNYNKKLGWGQLPILKQTWEHPLFAGENNYNTYYKKLSEDIVPYAMRLDPINVKTAEVVDKMGKQMIKCWKGKISAEEAVQKAAELTKKIMAK